MFFKVGAFYQPLGNATKRRCYFYCRLSELFAKSSQNSLFGYFVIKQTRMCNFFYFCCWQFHYPLYNTPHLPSTAGSKERGRLAQLGEHRPYKARVTGSSPVASTTYFEVLDGKGHWFNNFVASHSRRPPLFLRENKKLGRLAQLGEHRPYKARGTGSSPVASTISFIKL